MFKKFSPKEDIASNTVLKSSSQRAIRQKLLQQLPLLAAPSAPREDDEGTEGVTVLERLWPKKESLFLVKCRDHISILALHGEPLFFQHFDGPYFPTLRLLHRYPDLLPPVRVDRGAIKFVLSGANIMCPGLTSAGASNPSPTPPISKPETPVAVLAEGKEEACAIGLTEMSTEEMRSVNKGIGVENLHWLGDDLWALEKL